MLDSDTFTVSHLPPMLMHGSGCLAQFNPSGNAAAQVIAIAIKNRFHVLRGLIYALESLG